MTGQLVHANGIQLWVERDGRDGDPVVVLLGGADATVERWPAAFVAALVAHGSQVVRIEHRDSGRSTKIDADAPYRLADMAHDAAGVLDALGIDRADIVGYSIGGAIAQELALDHPTRVRSLVLVATTPGAGDERLPGPDDEFVARMTDRLFVPPPRTDEGRVEWAVDLHRLLAGDRYVFDEEGQLATAVVELAIGWYPESGHGVAATASPSRLDRLSSIGAPTLVVHGTRDVVYAVEHAEALAEGIPGARLHVVEGLGHEVPAAFADELASLVGAHLTQARQ